MDCNMKKRSQNIPNIVDRLYALISRTGGTIEQINGQRVYTRNVNALNPPKGCEVFVGKIPRNLYEDELVTWFERAGPVHQVRLMMDFNGLNRGYAFVTFTKLQDADNAVKSLNGGQIRPGRVVGVYKSVDNCRLFVGGIPVDKTREEVLLQLLEYVEGIVDVIMYNAYGNRQLNRGFVFVEFENHRMAAMARRKLAPGSLVLWGVPIIVDWAEPLPEVESQVMSKVTKLYIRNLDINMHGDDVMQWASQYVPRSDIIKIHKIKDFAFVHFKDRISAERGLSSLKGRVYNGLCVEVEWARPQIYSKANRETVVPGHFCTSMPPRVRKMMYLQRQGSNGAPSVDTSLESVGSSYISPHASPTGLSNSSTGSAFSSPSASLQVSPVSSTLVSPIGSDISRTGSAFNSAILGGSDALFLNGITRVQDSPNFNSSQFFCPQPRSLLFYNLNNIW